MVVSTKVLMHLDKLVTLKQVPLKIESYASSSACVLFVLWSILSWETTADILDELRKTTDLSAGFKKMKLLFECSLSKSDFPMTKFSKIITHFIML